MKQIVYLVLSLFSVNAHFLGPARYHSRHKRDAVGALDIMTNNAQPIHAEVKNENVVVDVDSTTSVTVHPDDIVTVTQELHGEVKPEPEAVSTATATSPVASVAPEKPCPKPYVPASIEMGTVFQVTPPKDVSTVVVDYPVPLKSGRKSWPLNDRLDLVRSVSRMTTLGVLLITVAIELYPLISHIIGLYK